MENARKLLSVVIPYYNTPTEFCRRRLRSLENLPREDVEVIVVNDGSRSDSWGAMLSLLQEFDFDVITFSKENGGQNSARQTGLDNATGQYVMFCDSDDYVEPVPLVEILEYLRSNEPPILAFGFDRVKPDGTILDTCSPWPQGFGKGDLQRLLLNSDSLCRQLYCLKRLRKLSFGLVQGVRIGEDTASALSFLLTIGEAETYGGVVYHYVQRGDSTLHRPPADSMLDIQRAFDEVLDRCPNGAMERRESVECEAILHVLYWGGMRVVLNLGNDRKLKTNFFAWMDDRFPEWRNNRLALSVVKAGARRWDTVLIYRLIISGHWGLYSAYLSLRKNVKRVLKRH